MEIINRSRAASKRAPDFAPSVKSARPFIAKKEAYRVVIPLAILTTMGVSCGPQGQEVAPTATEMPKPITDQITEQMNASQPFAGYDTGISRKAEPYIQEMTPKYGEFKGSTALIGIDADNSRVMSEMFAFEKGVFVLFYNEEGKAVSEMAPVSVNYAYDNKNNLNMVFKATLTDGDSEAVKASFLTLTSGISLDDIAPEVLQKAMAGDKETLKSFIQYFDQPEEIIGLNYSNPVTHKSVSMESQTTPSWSEKILKALQAVNPLSVSVVHAAAPAENIQTVEATATVPPTVVVPAINVEVKTAIGEEEYNEIKTGEVKGKDYSTGKDFDGTVEVTSVKAVSTADANFPNIVTAEATDSAGKKFAVVWNPETNNWVRVTEVNRNINDYTKGITFGDTEFATGPDLMKHFNYTHFENIDKMVELGDFNLVLLAQGIGSEAFPPNTERAQYGIGIERTNTTKTRDYFTYIDLMRADHTIPEDRKDLLNYQDFWYEGFFTSGNEPYQPEIGFKGTTSKGESIVGFAQVFQNSDETNFTVPLSFDPRQFIGIFTAEESKDAYGNDGMQRMVLEHRFKFVPIILTDNPSDWNNLGDGGSHLVSFRGISFNDDVVASMQTPGEGFKLIPADLQEIIIDSIDQFRSDGQKRTFLFPEGNLPLELVKFLTRNLNDVAATAGHQ